MSPLPAIGLVSGRTDWPPQIWLSLSAPTPIGHPLSGQEGRYLPTSFQPASDVFQLTAEPRFSQLHEVPDPTVLYPHAHQHPESDP